MSHASLSRRTRLGFTLIELIVTIVILGILAALAVPAFSAVQDRSRDAVLEAELEALGRGVAALAAFDGGGVTAAHVEEFLAGETSAATVLATSDRWSLYADADAPATPAAGDLLVAATGGYVGLATPAGHRDGQVAYAVVGTSGAVSQLTGVVDADGDTAVMRGADALCFYGADGVCTADATAEPVPGTHSSTETSEPVASEPVAAEPLAPSTIAFTSPGNVNANSVATLGDGGTVVAGSLNGTASIGGTTVSTSAGTDAFVARLDANGTAVWVATAGGDGSEAVADVAIDGTDVYVTGYTGSTAGMTGWLAGYPTSGLNDAYVARLNLADGTTDWVKTAGGSDHDGAATVAVDSTGVYVGGYVGSTTGLNGWLEGHPHVGMRDAYVTRLDVATGARVWTQTAGGSDYDYAQSVDIDDTGVYVAGSFKTTATAGWLNGKASVGSEDAYVARLAVADGTSSWVQTAGGSNNDSALSVAVDSSGVYIAGEFQDSNVTITGWLAGRTPAGMDVFAARLAVADGTRTWVQAAGGTGTDRSGRVAVDGTGVYVTGNHQSTTGLAGWLAGHPSAGGWDTHLTRLNPADGTTVWARSTGGTLHDTTNSAPAVDTTGVYVAGPHQSTGTLTGWLAGHPSTGNYDSYLARITHDGTVG